MTQKVDSTVDLAGNTVSSTGGLAAIATVEKAKRPTAIYPSINGKHIDVPLYCPKCGSRTASVSVIQIRYTCGGEYVAYLSTPHGPRDLWQGRCYNAEKAIEAGLDPTTPDIVVDERRRELGL